MANSRLGMETKAITEGAVMAGLTAVLAMTGIYIPMLAPIVMLVWTLPVVVICLHHGMRAGALTMAVAGLVILIISTPLNALSMLIRSAGPALALGFGLHRSWRTERTLVYTTAAAFIGIAASLAISIFVMGISFAEMFSIDGETVGEIVKMAADYGLLTSIKMTEAELTVYITEIFALMIYLLPAILLISSLTTALTNFMVAQLVLGKLRISLPPVTKLADFQLPLPFIYGIIGGIGLSVAGRYLFPGDPTLPVAGQNITIIFLALYFFQGMGVISHYIRKASPQSQRFYKGLLIVAILITFFYLLVPICFVGVADVFMDFRGLDLLQKKK